MPERWRAVRCGLVLAVVASSSVGRVYPQGYLRGDSQDQRADSLFGQSAQSILTRRWPPTNYPHLSWMILDASNGQVLARQWPSIERAIPVGSLTKPFLAVAYSSNHTNYPRMQCYGKSGVDATGHPVERCWSPHGHGELDLQAALANSCNAYFLGLARQISPSAMNNVAGAYGLPVPPLDAGPATLIGLDAGWEIPPLALARGYLQLLSQPGAEIVLKGLHDAAYTGTASALRAEDGLAKTGTAPCQGHCLVSSDGLVIVMTPAASPRLLLFVRQEGTTGAKSASIAAQMLNALKVHNAETR